MGESRLASRYNSLDQIRRNMEGGRAFDGIENSQPAAGSSADIQQASPGANARHNPVHSLGEARDLGRDRAGHFLIFLIDDCNRLGGW